MNLSGPFEAGNSGRSKACVPPPRAVEKASASSQLDSGSRDFHQPDGKPPPRLQVELLCRDETPRFDPFRDGPRLVPSFVAQVLGQVMPERRHAGAMAHTAYASAAPRKALLVDGRS